MGRPTALTRNFDIAPCRMSHISHTEYSHLPVLRLEGPAHEEDVLDLARGLEVGERGLHALPHQPDDRLGRLLLPRPLGRQQLVPGRKEGQHEF